MNVVFERALLIVCVFMAGRIDSSNVWAATLGSFIVAYGASWALALMCEER